ncbi:MAG: alpha/beta hydrolase [Desulfoferrobacter sp.]
MIDISRIDYSQLDKPQILSFVFHPRPEMPFGASSSSSGHDLLIPTEKDLVIGARFHITDESAPNILFFHGNGEIVGDYDDLGPLYNRKGINFLAVDYRGYGRSTGDPTITGMMRDCHFIFEFSKKWLDQNGYDGPFIVMGRSLGSASALELAAHYGNEIDGLIVESGFAYAIPLLKLLGIDTDRLGIREEQGFRNIDKIRHFDNPTLIIHAEWDHIIPFTDGRALYDACPSAQKTLLKIPQANHNDIFMRGLKEYMAAIKQLTQIISRSLSENGKSLFP